MLGRASVAAAGLDHHVTVLPQDDVVAAVIVEHRGGTQFGGCTACLGDNIWFHQVHLAGGRGHRQGYEPGVLFKGLGSKASAPTCFLSRRSEPLTSPMSFSTLG